MERNILETTCTWKDYWILWVKGHSYARTSLALCRFPPVLDISGAWQGWGDGTIDKWGGPAKSIYGGKSFSINHTATTGIYRINHGFGSTDYGVIVTARGGTYAKLNATATTRQTNYFELIIHDVGTGSATDTEFSFIMFELFDA